MFTILNRLRGTWGWFAKVNAVVLGLLVYLAYGNYYIALICSLGYLLGESFGWGEWVGNLTTHRRNTTETLEDEGESNGIKYIATRIVSDWANNYLRYCRVALVLRGAYWWLLALGALLYVSYWYALGIVVLALAFPVSCEIGHHTSKLWNFKHMNGGWEHQEVWYGLMQDIVFIFLIWGVL